MAFHKFQKLAPELRQWIWKEAILEEADERIFFVHAETFRILPTENIICHIFGVNWEARQVALKHYPVKMPIFKLPSLDWPALTFEEWVVQTAYVQWGRGGPWGRGLEMGRQSWSNVDRYWHHYAMPKLGESANQLIKDTPSNPQSQDSGCIRLSPVTDRFLLSHPISDRDNADEIVNWPSSCAQLVVREPDPDLCSTHIRDSAPLHVSPLSMEVRRNIRRVVFADVQDDGIEPYQEPEHIFGEQLALFPGVEDYEPLTQDEAAEAWKADDFPQIRRLLGQPQPKLLYLKVPASESRTLVGKVEMKTAKCLEITEVDVEDVTNEDN
ncbi:hypothetical protein PG996_011368 [Apiospora saccharicola]|uniref:2EXR domain-containing protein n=1 Tax=Apiospora saccharicola TaxID=335842 RepID=A0ABR1UEX2_9PEZI